ncbi:hypothetical protein M2323_002594 [Rhodoblastus acidophilus]|uniref:hypothetical protein n=1 Tax=Rhodoblastus acidophilus TaxID=1074 RepID=UPI0022254CB6|nr:hypothetical protein [Rhodoblastus acidophilus]MCW2284707.1 hypothetical protein [Rhodoblastus acidophilus]MCW2333660.1 hypothetical protein [Rhodoblastus acidophilus]
MNYFKLVSLSIFLPAAAMAGVGDKCKPITYETYKFAVELMNEAKHLSSLEARTRRLSADQLHEYIITVHDKEIDAHSAHARQFIDETICSFEEISRSGDYSVRKYHGANGAYLMTVVDGVNIISVSQVGLNPNY